MKQALNTFILFFILAGLTACSHHSMPTDPSEGDTAKKRGNDCQHWSPRYTSLTKRPFHSSSPWNSCISRHAQYKDDPILRTTNAVWVNHDKYGIALFITDPTFEEVEITYPEGYGVVPGGTAHVRIGTQAKAPSGTDGTITIIDPINNKVWDFWQLTGTGKKRKAINGVSHPLNGTGVGDPKRGPYPAGIRAAWVSASGGLLRGWHFEKDAVINHALAVSLLNDQLKSGPVLPAVAQDSNGHNEYAGTIPMGTRLAIPRSVNINSLGLTSDIGRKIAKSAQDYGMYVVDRHHGDASLMLYSTPTEVTNKQLTPLRSYWDKNGKDLLRIRNALRIVK